MLHNRMHGAMHTVMQHIPLSHVPSIEEAEQTVHRLYEKELLTEEQKDAIDIEEIVQFFHTASCASG